MLSDLLLLETYYESQNSVQFLEDLSRRYGPEAIRRAVSAGEVICRRVNCGPECGRFLLRLSDKGRRRAEMAA